MLDKQFLRAFTGERTFNWGQDLCRRGFVSDLNAYEDPETGLVNIEADVEDDRIHSVEHVTVLINDKGGWIIDYDCGCPFFQKFRHPCNHIAAVLYSYIEERESGGKRSVIQRKTDRNLTELMDSLAEKTVTDVPAAPVVLEPQISFMYDSLNCPVISFRIGMQGRRMYILQSISDFTRAVMNNEKKKYGKELEFVHELSSFAVPCRPLVEFLMSLTGDNDSFGDGERAGYYSSFSYMNRPVIGKYLSLKGRYLDRFFEVTQNLPLYVIEPFSLSHTQKPFIYTVHEGKPSIPVSMEQTEGGYYLQGAVPLYYKGGSWLYFPDLKTKAFVKVPRGDLTLEKFLDYMQRSENRFIADGDLSKFTAVLYPVLNEYSDQIADTFDPEVYRPLDPVFEIYLDAPKEGMITAELYAVYGEKKYNVLAGIEGTDRRNVIKEKEMDSLMSGMFNSFDHENRKLVIINDDDLAYTFVSEEIPVLQEKAAVFISDNMKQIRVYRSPRINAGISVSHDLLRLDLVSNDMSLKELGEILYKYDRRKKYHRLRNGSFIRIDDDLENFRDFSEKLHLSAKDIASGEIELPRYRAFYLDALAMENEYLSERPDFLEMVGKMKNIDHGSYQIPERMQGVLREYQKEGFRWMSALKDNGFGALLADEMGLGKTVQVIALLGSIANEGRSLIVCPASLVYNWASELRRFMPELKTRMISGSSSLRRNQILNSGENEILITSYDLLKRDIEVYRDMEFVCEIIDEAQYIKNASTQAARAAKLIRSSFRIALTGTPIENRLSELWSIFDFILPGYFYSYEWFRTNYESPIVKDGDPAAEEQLRKMIGPFILRRKKKDVLKDLPDKLEEVYYAPLEGEQKELYDARVRRLKLMLETQSEEEFRGSKIEVLSELTKLRQICCDPALIYDRYTGNTAKREMCIDLIRKAVSGGHKVLLFSQFVSMLKELMEDLEREKIRYHVLTGETSKENRAKAVSSFQTDDVPVFCISLKAGGTGLNLTAADIVIHYDPWWNTAVENQASDRAHRIGQTNVVTVYRLIMENTIEERILQMQEDKTDLAGRMLSSEGISSARLSKDELIEILT